jgi:hypothetical protein
MSRNRSTFSRKERAYRRSIFLQMEWQLSYFQGLKIVHISIFKREIISDIQTFC